MTRTVRSDAFAHLGSCPGAARAVVVARSSSVSLRTLGATLDEALRNRVRVRRKLPRATFHVESGGARQHALEVVRRAHDTGRIRRGRIAGRRFRSDGSGEIAVRFPRLSARRRKEVVAREGRSESGLPHHGGGPRHALHGSRTFAVSHPRRSLCSRLAMRGEGFEPTDLRETVRLASLRGLRLACSRSLATLAHETSTGADLDSTSCGYTVCCSRDLKEVVAREGRSESGLPHHGDGPRHARGGI